MNRFDGRLIHSEDKLPLNNANLLLRSSKLKNTEWIYLLALYTGHSSKIVMSMNRPRTKRSTIESKLGYLIGCTFCFMLVLSLVATVLKITANTKTVNLSFAFGDTELFFVSMISWILNLNNLVPISLIVTVEMVKLLETKLIGLDPAMSREDVSTRVNCSNILEDLGVIDCVASDKTGTLTKNKLTMRQLSDGLLTYNCSSRNVPERVLLMLSSAHEVSRSSSGDLEGTSQDEIAILEFCMLHDIELSDRTTEALTLKIGQRSVTRKILRCLEFTSERKRQSVLFEEKGKVWLVVKGADEQMLSIMKPSDTRDNIYMDLFTFAKEGLRTLVYGCRSLPTDIAEQWCKDYQLAEFNKNHDRMKQLEDDLERDLNALCATAIEDELQDEVV
jgi:phospholipid-transporting ATPase